MAERPRLSCLDSLDEKVLPAGRSVRCLERAVLQFLRNDRAGAETGWRQSHAREHHEASAESGFPALDGASGHSGEDKPDPVRARDINAAPTLRRQELG